MDSTTEPTYPWLSNYPPDVDWQAEISVQSLPDMFDGAIARYRGQPCTHFLGTVMTYDEIGDLADRIAAGLQANGLKAGDKIGLLLPNCPYFIAFYFAAMKIGCVIVNYNPLYTVEEIEFQVRDSETVVMVSLDLKVLFDKVEALLSSNGLDRALICPFAALLPFVKGL